MLVFDATRIVTAVHQNREYASGILANSESFEVTLLCLGHWKGGQDCARGERQGTSATDKERESILGDCCTRPGTAIYGLRFDSFAAHGNAQVASGRDRNTAPNRLDGWLFMVQGDQRIHARGPPCRYEARPGGHE
jgi:hypothetical protein